MRDWWYWHAPSWARWSRSRLRMEIAFVASGIGTWLLHLAVRVDPDGFHDDAYDPVIRRWV